MKKLFMSLAVVALVLFTALPAYAVMVTTYESGPTEGGEPGPAWCLDQDDSHWRNFQGTLQPGEAFIVTERFCTLQEENDFYGGLRPDAGSGSVGLFYKAVYSRGQSISLYVIFPDGTIRYAHPVSGYYALDGCVAPLRQESSDPRGRWLAPIPGGTYQVVLTNTGTKTISSKNPLTEVVWANSMGIDTQRADCPPEDWNIEPA
jgi:hypothetical protein